METAFFYSALTFISIFLFFFGFDRILSQQSDEVGSRLDRYATRVAAESEIAARSGERRGPFGRINRALANRNNSQLANDLARANIKLTPSEFMMLNVISIVAAGGLAFFLTHNSLLFGLLGGIVGFYLPRFYIKQMQAARLSSFNNQLGDTLILLANSLRSGYSLLQSMETVSKELPPPMSEEFARVVREIGLGLSVEEALAHMLERVRSDDLDLVITAVNIQHEVGGNLAEILDTISHTIRERVRIKGQIRVMTAQQRFSGIVISVLPIGLGIVMFMISPGYIQPMWTESCGIMMLITGGIMIGIGYFVIRKITNIEV